MHKKSHLKLLTTNLRIPAIFLLLNGCSMEVDTATIQKYNKQTVQIPNNKNIVLVGGCFDVLHFGHIEFLKNAKAAGDYLIVALEPDESISNYKRRTPTHNQKERADILAALRFVDHVILLPVLKGFVDYNQLVENIKPQVIAITADDPQIANKQKQANSVRAIVKIVTPRISDFSSTKIKEKQDCYQNTTKTS